MHFVGLESIYGHDQVLWPWWSAVTASRLPGADSVVPGSIREPDTLFRKIIQISSNETLANFLPKWSNIEIFSVSGRLPD